MTLREYTISDCKEMAELFYQTVHSVNARDYTKEQLDAWAAGTVDLQAWNQSFLEHITIVAVENEEIVGFGDITPDGYLDRLYVHRDYQGKGIASAVCDQLEKAVSADRIMTHASITAKTFFENRGYRTVRGQQVLRNEILLTNYVMEKDMDRKGEKKDAVRLMKKRYGIDMEETQYSKLINQIPEPDIAISMGCNVECPFIGRPFDENWGLEDPTGKSDAEFEECRFTEEKNV